jgi:hypothetical protein
MPFSRSASPRPSPRSPRPSARTHGVHGVLTGHSWGTHGVLTGYSSFSTLASLLQPIRHSWGTRRVLAGYSGYSRGTRGVLRVLEGYSRGTRGVLTARTFAASSASLRTRRIETRACRPRTPEYSGVPYSTLRSQTVLYSNLTSSRGCRGTLTVP